MFDNFLVGQLSCRTILMSDKFHVGKDFLRVCDRKGTAIDRLLSANLPLK